jgi:hypothetical protein
MIKYKEMCGTNKDSSKYELMIASHFEGESRTHVLPHLRKCNV